mmetsp:Transcript_6868/g.6169  ORF Transcript_6868/g.6169 Transcript_6868/m.6169 type:complete len:404 (+) Transcript_6868:150-1361(+)|eukprot:CAMPEP_0196761402 /NCGR_PEP_ID=MMETSP1095-20130614/627_1 /TAXON_ID=96789 ORGANISM="Chromulina nebulosa, Strain UTEXLB2642" /NCGR_SAMPLE_ID=MMETSP1095 /ASSEMBLY_ACC=CAM_ASM_000446 /LENGTH=403 /DNA_ID=CAMNT_0042110905 /DNA_START=144 /DNA_END=1355 /DNA_ORIENTATION=-
MSVHSHSSTIKGTKIPPETITIEGTAKRNILRKGKHKVNRKDLVSGKAVDEDVYILTTDKGSNGVYIDENDPNYDKYSDISSEEIEIIDEIIINTREEIGKAKLTLSKYKRIIESLISDFFQHGDMNELVNSVQEIECPEYSYELVKRIINMSLDKSDRERELVSKFLYYSTAECDLLSINIIGKGFERLFEIIDEIEKDCPASRTMISKYLARCVLDEVLSPAYLADPVVCNLGGDVVDHAKRMLSREHVGAKLECCWGPGDGRPVEDLKIAIDQLLQEYLLSNDIQEATRCIAELNVPYYYHEIVKRAIVQSLDKSLDRQVSMSGLLTHLFKEGMLKKQQAVVGFNRVFGYIDDLTLDTPNAPQIIHEFVKRAIESNLLPTSYEFQELVKINDFVSIKSEQ